MTLLSKHGKATSEVEVTHISSHGIWVLVKNKEHFLLDKEFPWFLKATVVEILEVEEISPGHLYWPELDVDLPSEILEHPQKFPLKAKIQT